MTDVSSSGGSPAPTTIGSGLGGGESQAWLPKGSRLDQPQYQTTNAATIASTTSIARNAVLVLRSVFPSSVFFTRLPFGATHSAASAVRALGSSKTCNYIVAATADCFTMRPVYLFLLEVEPITGPGTDDAPAAATVLVNHHDHDGAVRMARSALSEHGWLLRSVVRSRVLVGEKLDRADATLAPFIAQATAEGVAFDIALLPKGLSPGDSVVEPWLMRRFEGDMDAAPDYPK